MKRVCRSIANGLFTAIEVEGEVGEIFIDIFVSIPRELFDEPQEKSKSIYCNTSVWDEADRIAKKERIFTGNKTCVSSPATVREYT